MAKILVVDDSGMSRRTLRRILEGAGHEVIEATDGMVALECYFIEKPALVMLDMVMTGLTGLEVLEKLREMDPQAQIIVATADIQTSTRDMVKDLGAVGFVNKPFVAEQLLKTVEAAFTRGEQ